jgi:hypothetical protein
MHAQYSSGWVRTSCYDVINADYYYCLAALLGCPIIPLTINYIMHECSWVRAIN